MNWFGGNESSTRQGRRRPSGEDRLSAQTRTSKAADAQSGPKAGGQAGTSGRSGVAQFFLTLFILALLVGGGGTLWKFGRKLVVEKMDEFQIRNVYVGTDGVLSRNEILAVGRVRTGMNIFTIDLPELQRRLRRHPRIASVELERRVPSTLIIGVRERVPVARILPVVPVPGGVHYLVDREGHVMLPFPAGMAPAEVIRAEASLPVLYGVQAGTFAEGAPTADPRVLAALQFLGTYELSPLNTVTDIISVDLNRPGDLEVVTSHGSRITFGIRDLDPDFKMQVRNWVAVHQESVRLGRVIDTLDLSVTNNAPLRWLELPPGSFKSLPTQPVHGPKEIPHV